jgi:hypothetical protein
MDRSLMERMFSNEQAWSNLPTSSEEISEETKERMKSILEQMERINPIEADMIELHILKGVPQSALGRMFQYSQPNIHYRVNRALERIKVLLRVPVLDPVWIEEELSKHFSDEKDVKVMILLYIHSSQSYAARIVEESQGKVRYRFLRCLGILKEIESLSIIYTALSIINENLTLLRKGDTPFEVKRTLL